MMGMRQEESGAKFATAQPIDHILASPLGTHWHTLAHTGTHWRTLAHTGTHWHTLAASDFLTKWHTGQSGQTLNGKYLQAQ